MELKDLDKMFDNILKKFPDAKRKLVEEAGEKMYKKVINNIETSVKENTGNLKSAVTKVVGSKGGYSAVKPDWKKAPHTALVENGHKLVKENNEIGWVAGKHMYRNALNSLVENLEKDAENMINELLGDLND